MPQTLMSQMFFRTPNWRQMWLAELFTTINADYSWYVLMLNSWGQHLLDQLPTWTQGHDRRQRRFKLQHISQPCVLLTNLNDSLLCLKKKERNGFGSISFNTQQVFRADLYSVISKFCRFSSSRQLNVTLPQPQSHPTPAPTNVFNGCFNASCWVRQGGATWDVGAHFSAAAFSVCASCLPEAGPH